MCKFCLNFNHDTNYYFLKFLPDPDPSPDPSTEPSSDPSPDPSTEPSYDQWVKKYNGWDIAYLYARFKKRLLINSLVALPPTSGVRGVVVVVVVVLDVVDGVSVQFCMCKWKTLFQ